MKLPLLPTMEQPDIIHIDTILAPKEKKKLCYKASIPINSKAAWQTEANECTKKSMEADKMKIEKAMNTKKIKKKINCIQEHMKEEAPEEKINVSSVDSFPKSKITIDMDEDESPGHFKVKMFTVNSAFDTNKISLELSINLCSSLSTPNSTKEVSTHSCKLLDWILSSISAIVLIGLLYFLYYCFSPAQECHSMSLEHF